LAKHAKQGGKIKKELKSLRTVVRLQNAILIYIALFVSVAVSSWFAPLASAGTSFVVVIFFYGLILAIPYALSVMFYSLHVFQRSAKHDHSLKVQASIAGLLACLTGIYILIFFIYQEPLNQWAFLKGHEFVVALQSSPVILGLILLATHVFIARSTLTRLNNKSSK
jgi:hypothetical protein